MFFCVIRKTIKFSVIVYINWYSTFIWELNQNHGGWKVCPWKTLTKKQNNNSFQIWVQLLHKCLNYYCFVVIKSRFCLAFDFCRFCVVIHFCHHRHNGQWPLTSNDSTHGDPLYWRLWVFFQRESVIMYTYTINMWVKYRWMFIGSLYSGRIRFDCGY